MMGEASGAGARALVYIQYLLGIGHVMRGMRLARALKERGASVTVAFGGVPAPGLLPPDLDIVQLDPARVAPENMSRLLAADGSDFDDGRRAARRDLLLALFARVAPDILLIESFPFARRQMRFELIPLLEAAAFRPGTVIASSIRDILQENPRADRVEEICRMFEAWFDLALVHGEEAVTPLSLTFPQAARLAGRTVYTGMIGPEPPARPVTDHQIVISAGGGAVGAQMMPVTVEAMRDPRLAGLPTLLLLGPNLRPEVAAGVRARAPEGVDVRTFVPDLTARLAGARLSVSQAGYNTVADILVAGCPAVVLPFEGPGETEQLTRARALAASGRAAVITERELTPGRLADAIVAGLAAPRAASAGRLSGAAVSAGILLEALSRKRGGTKP